MAAAGVITSLTGASTATLTTLFAGTGLVPGIVDSFQKTFLLGEVGDKILFENEHIRMWEVRLEPGQTIPFHIHHHPYLVVSLGGGDNDDRADDLAKMLVSMMMNKIRMYPSYRSSTHTQSVLTITSNVVYGKGTGTTPDGRKKGEPFAPGANPSNGRDTHGALAALMSVAKIPYDDAEDGISLTISVVPTALGTEDDRIARGIGAQLMATQGPLTRTVRDARLALAIMAKGDRRDTRWVDAPLTGPPPPRPIRVALVPEVPGGETHPAQVEAVRRTGLYLRAAGYRVEEVMPPDIEEAVRLWHAIGSNDVFRLLAPSIEEHGDAAARISLREWLALYPPTDSLAALDALARRDLLLWRWLEFFNDYSIIVLPTHCDLPPPWGEDQTRGGQQRCLLALRVGLIAPLLGLAGLAVPVGVHGALRTGVQIVPSRFREDLALDAGEVIEAAEGVVATIDPAW